MIVVASAISSQAQMTDFATIEQRSYNLYQRKEWNELLEVGRNALKADVDYYYLRMRMGIAYYERENYRASIPHFLKALEFDSKNKVAAEYLYYAYLFSGRNLDANIVYSRFYNQLKASHVPKTGKIFNSIYSEVGFKTLSPRNDGFGNLGYKHVGIEQQLGSRLNLYYGISQIRQSIYLFDTETTNNGRVFYIDETEFKYQQNEYFVKGTIPVIRGLQVFGGYHFQSISDTIPTYTNVAFIGGIKTNIRAMDFDLSFGQSEINNTTSQQLSGNLIWYPTYSLNFYLQSNLTLLTRTDESNSVFYQKVGFRSGPNTWIEIYGSKGNMRGMQELDGFYLYNLKNDMDGRLGVSMIFLLNQKHKWILGYTKENYTEISTSLPYSQHYLFTGFNLKF